MKILDFSALAAFLPALVLSAGCGQQESPNAPSQVAARLNGEEITVHQINFVLARSQNIAPEVSTQAKREVLDRLIDQYLARQKAIEQKLDRSPNAMQTIEAAKSEILARAYLEHLASTLPKPAPWEIQKYYAEHPELFALRRLFNLEELAFSAKPDTVAALREQLPKSRSMQEIADWLQSREIKFVVNRGVRAAEQIPLEILPKVQAMKEDQIQLFEPGNERFQVIRVVAYKAEPVDEATAAPRIQQFLLNQRSSEFIAKELKKNKDQAKIEYLGEFAGGAVAAKSNVKAEAEARTKPGAKTQAK